MKGQNTCLFFIGVSMWYISSIMVNVHWKSTFKSYGLTSSTTSHHFQYAMFFTIIQFAAGAVTSFISILFSGKLENITSLLTWWRAGAVIGGFFYLGQLSTNISLTMTSVTLTHLVKTLEPLLALVWSITILKNKISYASMICMQIMLVGVILAGYSEVTFNHMAVIFAIISNVSLSLRNLTIKLFIDYKKVNGLQLFFLSCICGCLYSLSLYAFSQNTFIKNDYHYLSKESIKMGMYFSGQHIMSYLLLYYVSITSHAILNCLKRALIIFISAIILQVKLPTIQVFGIIFTIIGSIFYVFEMKNSKQEDDGVLDRCGTVTKNIDYRLFKPGKLIQILLVILLICLTWIGTNKTDLPLESINEHTTAVWAFDAPINLRTLDVISSNLDTSIVNLNIFCSNVEKCQKSVMEFNSTSLLIYIIQLKAFELSKYTPVAAWMAAHQINKIRSLTCFPAYFHKMMYLSALWKFGGIVIDMALTATKQTDIKDFMISSLFEGCLLDQSNSSAIMCNLPPEHKYTEVLMGEISKMFMMNPKTCTFNNSLQKSKTVTYTVASNVGYTIPLSKRQFGLLGYGRTNNIGDEMQSVAAAHILPHIHTFINRQTFTNPDATNLTFIGNAWWDEGGILFKDIQNLIAVPVAVHISPPAYGRLLKSKSLLSAMAPIGARDLMTFEILMKNGIESIFTGCLTLWMKNPDLFKNLKINNQTIIVDINWRNNPLQKILTNIKYMSHGYGGGTNRQVINFSQEQKYNEAYKNLMEYAQAKVVITSRIHVALPCVAMGTPVIFYSSKEIWDAGNKPPSRVAGLLDLFHTVDMYKLNETSAIEYFKTFNWNNPPPNPNPEKVKLLKSEARKILVRIPELAVSLKVLELI